MPEKFLVCLPCKRISELVKDYRPDEEMRGEWELFRREHRGDGHEIFIGTVVGQ